MLPPNILQTTHAGVLLNSDLATSDSVEFARHIALNDESAWEAAVGLVHGPFLEGFALPSSPEFDMWLLTMQQQLSDNVDEVLRYR